ncbi:MAG: hypothetical protein HPY59_04075 [Anaerolineae bacterium]|nr:hypothetical protein [Anaerolineae bacterium]
MSENPRTFVRFDVLRRIEHILLIVSFSTLALTGLPQKFPTASISIFIVNLLGGIEMLRIIHRAAAVLFMFEAIYHLVDAGYRLYVKREEADMLPGPTDVQDALKAFLYNLGFAKHRPKMGRFNFIEKAEYWAVVWGLLIMAVTGFMLWNPIATTTALPGQAIPAAKVAHGAEAVLAVLAILIWHFYFVHLKKLNLSIFTGRISLEEMEDEHGAELEKLLQDEQKPKIAPETLRKRMAIYFPVATVLSLGLLYGVYRFVTLEQTAITTIPPVENPVEIYAPQTATAAPTQTASPLPAATLPITPPQTSETPAASVPSFTWEEDIAGFVQTSCSMCHDSGDALDLGSYAGVMKANGVVAPGDPENSLLIKKVADGKHPGAFTPEQIELLTAWINAGAPEKAP